MGYSVVRYMKPKYKTITGIARKQRKTGRIRRQFCFLYNKPRFISAISDGAGSGRRAERFGQNYSDPGKYAGRRDELNLAIRFQFIS